jgi:PTS system nitrogen regulatory IIA component
MNLERLIAPGSVAPSMRASSKKQLLHELAGRVAEAEGLDARSVFDALMERERLGATGMGRAGRHVIHQNRIQRRRIGG